jgi:hypothetical protein
MANNHTLENLSSTVFDKARQSQPQQDHDSNLYFLSTTVRQTKIWQLKTLFKARYDGFYVES